MTTKPSTVTRLGLAALGLSLLIPVLPATAFDRVSETGQQAIQDLLERKSNRNTRVVFGTTQRRTSGSDVILTGRGSTTRGNGNANGNGRNGGLGRGNGQGNARDFTYSVRVVRAGASARDMSIRFSNGETLTEAGPYNRNRANNNTSTGNDRATFTNPEPGFSDSDGDVTFAGHSAAKNVTLTILDRSGDGRREVTTRRVTVSNGTWRTNLRLAEGNYRARIDAGNGTTNRAADTVNFSVGRGNNNNDDRNNDNTRATFDRPENNFRDSDGEIRFSGDSEGTKVELRVYRDDRDDREVLARQIDVRDDRWDVTLRLDEGNYRATIRTVNGRSTSAVRFSVARN